LSEKELQMMLYSARLEEAEIAKTTKCGFVISRITGFSAAIYAMET
jgi:hypothetical protein